MTPQTTLRKLLAPHDFPETVLHAWERSGHGEPLPLQALALQSSAFFTENCLIIGPTSSGKTFLCEIAAVRRVLLRRQKCIYLVPLKALVDEKRAEFHEKYGQADIGMKIVASSADRRFHDKAILRGDFDIAIMTYEKLSTMLVSHPGLLNNVGVLVVDEIQMVADGSRGGPLEVLLARCRQAAPNAQLLGLSAVVGPLNGFDRWLQATVISDLDRPVPLREGALSPDGVFEYVESGSGRRVRESETLFPIDGATPEELAASLVGGLLRNPDEQVLVFVPSVSQTQVIARTIAERTSDMPPAAATLERLSRFEGSSLLEVLEGTLSRSIAFHSADMTQEERGAVEEGVRQKEIRCIVSTSTLAMGVNLPASTVVIVSTERWSKKIGANEPISVAEYRNMAGRAGRLGLHPLGRAIAIARASIHKSSFLKVYVEGELKPMESALLKRPLDLSVLQVIASGVCGDAAGVVHFLSSTFGGTRCRDEGRGHIESEVHNALRQLRGRALLCATDSGLKATPEGTICAAAGLLPATFARLRDHVDRRNVSLVDMAYLASLGDDTGPGSVNLWRKGNGPEAADQPCIDTVREAAERLGGVDTLNVLSVLSMERSPTKDALLSLKFQAAAVAYAEGRHPRDIEHCLSVAPARARQAGERCAWLCETAAKLSRARGLEDEAKRYELLSRRFQHGCIEQALFLVRFGHILHRSERSALVTAGYDSLQKILDASASDIARAAKINKHRIDDLQRAIVAAMNGNLDLQRAQAIRLRAAGGNVSLLEALYTDQGDDLERSIEELLALPFCPLRVSRITRQRSGEADLMVRLSTGRHGIIQVTAKKDASGRVGLTKAGEILQQSPELRPDVFVCIGRPDFLDDAIEKARAHASGGKNYKLIPIRVLAEMHVRFCEGRLSPDRVREILEDETGYLDLDRI